MGGDRAFFSRKKLARKVAGKVENQFLKTTLGATAWTPLVMPLMPGTNNLTSVFSNSDAELCAEIAAAAKNCLNLAGKTSLAQAIYALAASKFIVSNDSGLMHVSAALGVPQVAIFGSSSPLHTPPLSSKAAVLWLKTDAAYLPPLDCAPCFERVCPLGPNDGHMRCLNDIRAERVLAALPV